MIGTGAYAYYNIKVLNRYQTSDEQEKFSADYERKYLKYEKLPQPSITAVTLNVQLYPKKRMLDRRRPLRPRQQDQCADHAKSTCGSSIRTSSS